MKRVKSVHNYTYLDLLLLLLCHLGQQFSNFLHRGPRGHPTLRTTDLGGRRL